MRESDLKPLYLKDLDIKRFKYFYVLCEERELVNGIHFDPVSALSSESDVLRNEPVSKLERSGVRTQLLFGYLDPMAMCKQAEKDISNRLACRINLEKYCYLKTLTCYFDASSSTDEVGQVYLLDRYYEKSLRIHKSVVQVCLRGQWEDLMDIEFDSVQWNSNRARAERANLLVIPENETAAGINQTLIQEANKLSDNP